MNGLSVRVVYGNFLICYPQNTLSKLPGPRSHLTISDVKITIDVDQHTAGLLMGHYKVDSPEAAAERLIADAKRRLERDKRIVDAFNEVAEEPSEWNRGGAH